MLANAILFHDLVPKVPIRNCSNVISFPMPKIPRVIFSKQNPPSVWTQYDAVRNRLCRTNNASRGITIVYRSLSSAIIQLYIHSWRSWRKNRQILRVIREISQGMKVRRPVTCETRLKEDRIFNVVSQHETYVEDCDILRYLKAIHRLQFAPLLNNILINLQISKF